MTSPSGQEPGRPADADNGLLDAEEGEELRESQPGDLAANPPVATSGQTMARNSAVMAAGTVVSRVTGVLRDVAMTAALGFYLVSDAYSLGNSLPTVVYILVIGGALNAVFIPQLVRRMKEDDDDGKAYADRLLTLVATVLLVLSVVAVAVGPVDRRPLHAQSTTRRTSSTSPSRSPACACRRSSSTASTRCSARSSTPAGRFGAPMFAPIANNVVAIATFGLFIAVAGTSAAADGILTSGQVLILGIGTTLGVGAPGGDPHPGPVAARLSCGRRASTGEAPASARPADWRSGR